MPIRPEKNFIPERIKKIHLIAVCGTGMGALAAMLKDMGYVVSGSDRKVYPPMSTFLEEKKIPVHDGFSEENIDPDTDLVVVGNAVGKDNPEVLGLEKSELFYCSMPQAVNHFAARGKMALVVTGTHGKTTTASLLAWLLHHGGMEPSAMIGGIMKNFNGNYIIGNGEYIVIEGDEYDTAFFDKGPKFNHYIPEIAITTSVEFDHADIFRDLSHVKETFAGFMAQIPRSSLLLAYDSDKNIRDIIGHANCGVQYYGTRADSAWRYANSMVTPPWTRFEIGKGNEVFGSFKSPLMGQHNLVNTVSAIAACAHIGIGPETIAKGLETFLGVRRRQEVRGTVGGVRVLDDFAHHPTAVRETIKAVKPFCVEGRLIAVFEPRTNTSMRDVFQNTYTGCFDGADLICVRKPPLLEKVPPDQRMSSEKLVADLRNRGLNARYFPDTDTILSFLTQTARSGDTVLIMSNGGFDNLHERLLHALSRL